MRVLSAMEVMAIAGGYGEGASDEEEDQVSSGSSGSGSGYSGSSSGSGMQTVYVSASKAEVAAAKAEASIMCEYIGGLAGVAAGGITVGACVGGASYFSGGTATAASVKPCEALGAVVGTLTAPKAIAYCKTKMNVQ